MTMTTSNELLDELLKGCDLPEDLTHTASTKTQSDLKV
jgi:hypothetical protein